MKTSKIPGLGRFGAFIDDVDFATLDEEQWHNIGQAHLQNLVTIFRNTKNLTRDTFAEWVIKFGAPRYSVLARWQQQYLCTYDELLEDLDKEQIMSDADRGALRFARYIMEPVRCGIEVQRIQSGYDDQDYPNGLFSSSELGWHCDESGILPFVPGAALFGYKNMVGTGTAFVSTVDYYESASSGWRSELDDMIVLHKQQHTYMLGHDYRNDHATHLIGINACWEDNTEIPLVRANPGGLRGLNFSPATTGKIKHASPKESSEILAKLHAEIFVPQYMYQHWYQQDHDLLLFDNSVTMHRRLGNNPSRIAYRIAQDYSNLQQGFYQPYPTRPKLARRYIKQIRKMFQTQHANGFRMPGIRDYANTFFTVAA